MAKNQPAEIAMFHISEVQESPAFNGRRSFLTLRWLKGIPAGQPLFPRLAKRRTWLMIKKDLERAGIPYRTEEGTADFHAVGRHTYITELLRNGASLVEARELARHSDIRMTMRYTHIGLDDQAMAVAAIPAGKDLG